MTDVIKVVAAIFGSLVGAFIVSAIGLFGLSFYLPDFFVFDWPHLVALWCIVVMVRGSFNISAEVKKEK